VWAGHVTINILPDDVILHIFRIDGQEYRDDSPPLLVVPEEENRVWRLRWRWHRLVHVCRRWRSIVFASPNFLDLRLVCGPMTPLELTGIWPPFPIIITNSFDLNVDMPEDYDFDTAFVHPNRVREIRLFDLTGSLLQRLASATWMQEQFPTLTHLMLYFNFDDDNHSALPDEFLGGSAPLLQDLVLESVPFPALPKLLLSATDLVRLTLAWIPHTGYISPEVIVTSLAVLVNLESLTIGFASPLSRPGRERRRPLPPTRAVLPALARFTFGGASEYLEDLVARIDAPLLHDIWITFFHQLIFDIPQLAQFMGRTAGLKTSDKARVEFDDSGALVKFLPQTGPSGEGPGSVLKISCKVLEWQLSSLAQLHTLFFPSIYMVEHLYIYTVADLPSQWLDDIENVQWLEFSSHLQP
jgi:hypothetical protein